LSINVKDVLMSWSGGKDSCLTLLRDSEVNKLSGQSVADHGDTRLRSNQYAWCQAGTRASGLDVIDFAVAKRIRRWVDFDLSIDNLTNKRYFETQNFFASRLPGDPPGRN
jgi:outer membrane receptor protein involved in Fe transport